MSTEKTQSERNRDPDQIERDIDQIRQDLGHTLDALEQRLSPHQLFDQGMGLVRTHGGEFAANLGDSVKRNPIPLLFAATGMAWLMMGGQQRLYRDDRHDLSHGGDSRHMPHEESKTHKASAALRGARDSVREQTHAMKDKVGHARHEASDFGHSTAERARGAGRSFSHVLEERPMMVCGLGIALGMALGAALPKTDYENRKLGSARDRALDRTQAAHQRHEEARSRAALASEPPHKPDGRTKSGAAPVTSPTPPPSVSH